MLVGPDWRSPLVFSYFGPAPSGESTNWSLLWSAINEWANELVMPRVLELNRQRILRAVPEPPQWDPALIESTLVIDDGAARQGTGFLLEGIGVVTCNHVLTGQSMVFVPRNQPDASQPASLLRGSARRHCSRGGDACRSVRPWQGSPGR